MTQHSTIGPSSAERWFNCPGSVALTANLPNPTSKYAAEGTLAHTLAEDLVTGKTDSLKLYKRIGDVVTVDGHDVEITEEMVSAAEEYRDIINNVLNELREERRPGEVVFKAEVRLSGEAVNKALFGTADYLLYQKGNTLHVFDFKYGKGHAVEVVVWEGEGPTLKRKPNKQLGTYAVMAMDGEAGWAFDKIVLHVHQPRAQHVDGGHRHEVFTGDEMRLFRKELVAAASATAVVGAPLAAGDWCKWCSAKASCPAVFKSMTKQAQVEFGIVPAPASLGAAVPGKAMLPSLEVLPIEQLAVALGWRETFDAWFNAAEERAQRELEAGRQVPGYKLVPGRSNRKWRDEAEVLAKFEPVLGDKVYEDPKVKSPAALEKLVGKKAGVEELTYKPEAPLKLAKDSDPRSATSPSASAAKAFPACPPCPDGTHKQEMSLEEELGLVKTAKEPFWP